MSESPDVAVIGAGWAGLASAIELVRAGRRPIVYEAAPLPGGRARAVTLRDHDQRFELDSGQHLLVGAYTETLALLRAIDTNPDEVLDRRPLNLRSTDGLALTPARGPAPWHLLVGLLRARGFASGERMACARLLLELRFRGWRVQPGESVDALMRRARQPPSLVDRLWAPLCIAMLNTRIEEACARTFANVLRDTLGADAPASDFLLPRRTLGEVLPGPAAAWLSKQGVPLRLRSPIRRLRRLDSGWLTEGPADVQPVRQVVLAIPPINTARLLDGLVDMRRQATLRAFAFEPIATVYLHWPIGDAPDVPRWTMLTEEPARSRYGQWLFDRGMHAGRRVVAVVVSARGRQLFADANHPVDTSEAGRPKLINAIAEQVRDQLRVSAPSAGMLITERRATFRCTSSRPLIDAGWLQDDLPGVFLAGDYCWPEYPATLEAAVRSGLAAARACGR